MHLRGALAVAAALFVGLLPGRARAWQEAHQTGDDVEVRFEGDAKASVRHTLRWHVVRGPLKSIELRNVDPTAELEGDVPITAENGRTLLAHAARIEDREGKPVRIVVDDPRALMHGAFVFHLSYRLDGVSAGTVTRDGATWRLVWSAPVAEDGFDGARSLFVFPAAPDPPRPIVPDTGAVDDSVVSTLSREPAKDVLELVRPHVARGEAVTWTVRVDPRAFPAVVDPRLRAPQRLSAASEPSRIPAMARVAICVALGLAYGWIVRRRAGPTRAVDHEGPAWSDTARAVVAGAAVAVGSGLEWEEQFTLGAACFALAAISASRRSRCAPIPPRGPGRWFAIRPEEAFAPAPPSRFPLVAGSIGVALSTLAGALSRVSPEAAWLVAIDAAVLVPVVVPPGGASHLSSRARAAARWLEQAFRKLTGKAARREGGLRVSPWARVRLDGGGFDELRLLVSPRAAMPGVLGLEVGVAWASTPVGWAASPEVLARVLEESPAAARLSAELPAARALPGRRPEERVVRMLPRAPTQASTVDLVRALADTLTDRRTAVRTCWTAPERRARPAEAVA